MSETIKPSTLYITQKIGWVVLRPILNFFIGYRPCLNCDQDQLTKPAIIASNHLSFLDPMILGTVLPINCKIYPSYFIAKDTIMTVPVLGSFLKFFGAFRAWRGQGLKKALAIPTKILAQGGSMVFFPQGRRFQDFLLEQGRPGTAVLALETNTAIVPVAICGMNPFSWKKFFLRRYRVKVVIGKPFFLKDKLAEFYASDNIEIGTQIIMQEIKKLLDTNI